MNVATETQPAAWNLTAAHTIAAAIPGASVSRRHDASGERLEVVYDDQMYEFFMRKTDDGTRTWMQYRFNVCDADGTFQANGSVHDADDLIHLVTDR
jgi:hypothetical protein